MRILVDTCVLSEVRRPKANLRVRARFDRLPAESIYLSVVTIGELTKGIEKLRAGKKKSALKTWLDQLIASAGNHILPIDLETAALWGEVSAKAQSRGQQVPPLDGLIAATAIQHGLHLMTRNANDFKPTGVMLINPWDEDDAGVYKE